MLLFSGLYNVALNAQPTTPPIVYESTPVIQESPDHRQNWLDGRVSLIGGKLTSSHRQYLYAEAHRIPVVTHRNFASLRDAGRLVPLNSPHIRFKSNRVIPFVLPKTREVVHALARAYHEAGCGRLVINDALRIGNRRALWNASRHSVHPRGMAVDVRTNIGLIGARCADVIWTFAAAQEAAGIADATKETCTKRRPCPHLHLVVVPDVDSIDDNLVAHYPDPRLSDQSE